MATRNVVDLPLIVDADAGFGNALNVSHAVKMLERAGASAIQLEDRSMPKRCGHFAGEAIVPAGEMVGKIKAAVARTARTVEVGPNDAAKTPSTQWVDRLLAQALAAGASMMTEGWRSSYVEVFRRPDLSPRVAAPGAGRSHAPSSPTGAKV